MSFARCLAIITIAVMAAAIPELHARQRAEQLVADRKPTVYNYVGKGYDRSVGAEAKSRYRDRFNVVDFNDERGYVRSKNTKQVIPRALIEGGRTVKGFVRVVFIVNENGRVIQPFVLRSTNQKLNDMVIDVIKQWSGRPALLNGTPIAILLGQDFTFR